MSFGLKNAGATYQRAIQACFKRQLNKNVEAYVDDVVIKTRDSSTLIDDLERPSHPCAGTAGSSTRTSASSALSVFYTGNLLRGVPEVDECGLAEIGNSKEETCGTQFRQVRAARCVIPYVLYVA
jgi:hypothetical protein